MKRMLRALLGWLLCQGSSDQVQEVRENKAGIKTKGNVVITDLQGKVIFDSGNTEANPGPPTEIAKSQAEKDFEYLREKYNPARDLATISRNRYDGLLRLSFENEEVNKWLDSQHFIFLDAAANIGIIRC